MTEHSGLKTPGGAIRRAREEQKLSLAELSDRTKIPPPVLEALEADEYHKVSGALYIKSFLRTCAAELGLETEEILDLYGRMSGHEASPQGGADMVWQEDEVQISRVGIPWRLVGVVGVALVLLGSGSLALVRGCGGGDDAAEETRVQGGPAEVPVVDAEDGGAVNGEAVGADDDAAADPDAVTGDAETRPTAPRRAADDSLARAWVTGRETPPARQGDPAPSATPAEAVPVATESGGSVEEAAGEPEDSSRGDGVVATSATTLPLPVVGGPNLVFAGGEKRAVVVRVICERSATVEVKLDGDSAFRSAVWPAAGDEAPALPATGIEPGRVYRSSRGFVVYWGAGDHLSLRLSRTDAIDVAVNGRPRDIRNLRPGGELLLDAHGQ